MLSAIEANVITINAEKRLPPLLEQTVAAQIHVEMNEVYNELKTWMAVR